MPSKDRRLNLYARDRDAQLWEDAREWAYRERVSLSVLVARAVSHYLDHLEGHNPPPPQALDFGAGGSPHLPSPTSGEVPYARAGARGRARGKTKP